MSTSELAERDNRTLRVTAMSRWLPHLRDVWPFAHLMRSHLLGGSRSDSAVLLCVACTLASVGVFACWLPARRATCLDPVKAIRYE